MAWSAYLQSFVGGGLIGGAAALFLLLNGRIAGVSGILGGLLNTPSGQTVLAGGGEIYLKLPASEAKLYASETNPAVSALRGFLVEVGSGPAAAPNHEEARCVSSSP